MATSLRAGRLIAAVACGAALLTPPAARGDVTALAVRVNNIDATWSWSSITNGDGNDFYVHWVVDTSGVTEKTAQVSMGSPAGTDYAQAKLHAVFTLNSISNTPLRIDAQGSSEGFVQQSSSHVWDWVEIKFSQSNSADFLVTDKYYLYNGPVAMYGIGGTIQPGDVVKPGPYYTQNFAIPGVDQSLKVFRGASLQNGPLNTTIEFTFTPLCPSDINHDSWVNGVDFDSFVEWFVAGDSRADYDANGFVNGVDFDQFVSDFEAGC